MSDEPTNADLIGAVSGLAMTMRRMIELTDRSNPEQVATTLDGIHEFLAVSGGSMVMIAERLGCQAEVERIVKEGQDRFAARRACSGLYGRA